MENMVDNGRGRILILKISKKEENLVMFNQLTVLKMRTQLFLANADFDFSFLQEPIPEGEDPLADATDKLKNVGRSAVNFFMVLGVISIVISIILLGLSFSISKNPQIREENKRHILWLIIGGVLVFGVFGFLGIIKGMAQGI